MNGTETEGGVQNLGLAYSPLSVHEGNPLTIEREARNVVESNRATSSELDGGQVEHCLKAEPLLIG
jgi:hypothetical protein